MFDFQLINKKEISAYVEFVDSHSASTLFHSLSWLDFIRREQNGVIHIYRISYNGEFLGYWPLIMVRKGPFKLMGSPLRGWLTIRMGPLLKRKVSKGLIQTLKDICKKNKINHFEGSDLPLNEKVAIEEGFSTKTRETWILNLEKNMDDQWRKLRSNCRKNIKKAIRSHIEIKQINDSAYFRPLYGMVVATYKKKKLSVPFSYDRLELLNDTIGKNKQMLFLGAFLNNKFIGGHIWGLDKISAYALVSASNSEFNSLRVNNLLIWEGIRHFVDIGLRRYDMYGGGKKNPGVAKFKASFGSEYCTFPHYFVTYSRYFSFALKVYEKIYLKLKKYPVHF